MSNHIEVDGVLFHLKFIAALEGLLSDFTGYTAVMQCAPSEVGSVGTFYAGADYVGRLDVKNKRVLLDRNSHDPRSIPFSRVRDVLR